MAWPADVVEIQALKRFSRTSVYKDSVLMMFATYLRYGVRQARLDAWRLPYVFSANSARRLLKWKESRAILTHQHKREVNFSALLTMLTHAAIYRLLRYTESEGHYDERQNAADMSDQPRDYAASWSQVSPLPSLSSICSPSFNLFFSSAPHPVLSLRNGAQAKCKNYLFHQTGQMPR